MKNYDKTKVAWASRALLRVVLVGGLLLAAAARAQFTDANGVAYTTNADNTLTVSGYTGAGGEVVIPGLVNGMPVVAIGDYAFAGSSVALTGFTLPNSITSIGFDAFAGCAMTSIILPNSLTNIGYYAFEYCLNLTNVTIPNSVITINDYAFVTCQSLPAITLPASATNIGHSVFTACSSLTNITVEAQNPRYSSDSGMLFDKNKTTLITYPSGIGGPCVISSSVTGIGDYAFEACVGLTGITIPDSVINIGEGAFWGCTNLPGVTLAGNLTNLNNYVFYGCSGLVSATLPGSLATLGSQVFYRCSRLTDVCFQGNAPTPSNDTNVFAGTSATIYYLAGATGWGSQFDGRPTVAYEAGGPPVIAVQPVNQSLPIGTAATFNIIAGPAPVTYAWYRDGLPIEEATNSSYTLNNIQWSDSGAQFSCRVSNAKGTILSSNAMLAITTELVQNGGFETGSFAGWSQSGNYCLITKSYKHSGTYSAQLGTSQSLGSLSQTLPTVPGATYLLSFWVMQTGGTISLLPYGEFRVTWRGTVLLDTAIPGLSWQNYQFTVTATDTTTKLVFYERNDTGYFFLDDVSVSVISLPDGPPMITAQPAGQSVSMGESATFSVAAVGTLPLSYAWQRNGLPVAGATNSSYKIDDVQLADNGSQFSCIVGNSFGTVTSSIVTLTVSANLVKNGGFEAGSFTYWNQSGSYCSVATNAYRSGVYGARLGTSAALGTLSQTLPTTPGTTYVLSFWLKCDGKTPNEFQAAWNGTTLFDGVNMGVFDWTNFLFEVTATDSATTLQFGERNDGGYLYLDDVSVVAVVGSSPAPVIQRPVIEGGNLTLNWTAVSGKNYTVEYRANLATGTWTTVTNLTATQLNMSFTLPVTGQQGFYRIGVEP